MIYLLGFCLFFSMAGFLMLLWRLWLVDGVLDTSYFILFGGGALIFVGIGIRQFSVPLLWTAVAFMGGGGLLYVIMESYYEKTVLRKRQREDVVRLRQRVELRIADWRALRDLGIACARLEMYDDAVWALNEAIRLNPPDIMDLRSELNKTLNLQNLGKRDATIICSHCHQETSRQSGLCVHCGRPVRFELGRFLTSPHRYGDIAFYVAVLLAALATGVSLFAPFSLTIKVAFTVICVVIAGAILWRLLFPRTNDEGQ